MPAILTEDPFNSILMLFSPQVWEVFVITRRHIITAAVAMVLSTVALAAPAAASSAVAPGSVAPSESRTTIMPPPQPPTVGGDFSAQQDCALGVWDGPNYTGKSACFTVTQLANWAPYVYPDDGTRINDTASSTWNYSNSRIRLCIHRDYVNCTSIVMHPDTGWARLNGWDNAVSSHFNASA